jgi:hypothetical protein
LREFVEEARSINGTASSKTGEKISARVTSHIFCPDENLESALVHDEAPRGETPPLATKSITDANAIPQLLQNFVVSTNGGVSIASRRNDD